MENNSSKKVLVTVLGVAILVLLVVGVSFAFFNYSKTSANTNSISTGTIYFNMKGNSAFQILSNAFPVSESVA